MASVLISPGPSVNPNRNPNDRLRTLLRTPISSRFPFADPWRSSRCPRRSLVITAAALPKSEHDVVVVGAGIVGLSIARQLLLTSDLSVAVVDAGVPCSGATGAGQGYIWMAHLTPGGEKWELCMRSKQLWEELASSIEGEGLDPLEELGWKKTGSLLIGRTAEELAMLERRVELLSQAGVKAQFLSATSLLAKEPTLEVGEEGGAAFLPDDCQLDAFRTVAFIEKGNKSFALQGRYDEFYNNPAIGLVRSERTGSVEGVKTSKGILYSKKALVIAAGAWSGSLMQSLVVAPDVAPYVPVKPRKGHLLVLENFDKFQLNHGLMEVGYLGHQVANSPTILASGLVDDEQQLSSISMTATIDVMGNLLLGSSRQFTGFDRQVDESIINRIWSRAKEFFPDLRNLSLKLNHKESIRIGHRPYMPDGKPVIGPVPGLPEVLLATGHEGSGLCMALGTAEMVADMILGNIGKVDCKPFSIKGRFGK